MRNGAEDTLHWPIIGACESRLFDIKQTITKRLVDSGAMEKRIDYIGDKRSDRLVFGSDIGGDVYLAELTRHTPACAALIGEM